MSITLERDIVTEVFKLRDVQQQEVLNFARTLSSNLKGTPGAALLPFAGTIDRDDLLIMAKTIEDGCEQVNLNEW
jgi:hypothetical protein